MSWDSTHQVRVAIECSNEDCTTLRHITIQGKNESDCVAQVNYERRHGICYQCEQASLEQGENATQPQAELRFAKCTVPFCGKILPLGAMKLHRADHARDKRTFTKALSWHQDLPRF